MKDFDDPFKFSIFYFQYLFYIKII